jgi:hypothetical protein
VSEAWISYKRLAMTLKLVPTSLTNSSLGGFASRLVKSTTPPIREDFGVALGFLSGDDNSNPPLLYQPSFVDAVFEST